MATVLLVVTLVISLQIQQVFSTAYAKLLLLRWAGVERSHVPLTAEYKNVPHSAADNACCHCTMPGRFYNILCKVACFGLFCWFSFRT